MNILLVMAGKNTSFKLDSDLPKFLYEINGKPIIELVTRQFHNLDNKKNKFIFLIKDSDAEKFYLDKVINLLIPNATVIKIKHHTEGAALTALLAIDELIPDQPLLIVNGDQIIDIDFNDFLECVKTNNYDAATIAFNSIHPRWSYVKIDENDLIVQAAEKEPISNIATGGIYYFKYATDYIESAMQMILKDAHVNNIFYVCPVLNEMILKRKKVGCYKINSNLYHSFIDYDLYKSYQRES